MSIATRLTLLCRHALRRIRDDGGLPDFLILGAQKAGTTSLYEYLCKSSDVQSPLRKEVHYFSEYSLKPIAWYRAFFQGKKRATDQTGEATPFYLFQPQVAGRIEAAGITPKLLVILRCPVDRAWSHYRHEKRKGREPLEYLEALLAENERLSGTTDTVLSEAHLDALRRKSYLARGRYWEQICRFSEIFGHEKIHVLTLDQLKSDPANTVRECCDFLEIAPPPPDTVYRVYNAGNEKSDMPDVDREIFRRAFVDDLKQLVSILPQADLWLKRLED